MSNIEELPEYDVISVDVIDGVMEKALFEKERQIKKLLDSDKVGFDDFYLEINEIEDVFSKVWNPFVHLNSVNNTEELRQKYEKWALKVSECDAKIAQNPLFFDKIKTILESNGFEELTKVEKHIIKEAYKALVRSGAELKDEEKEKYKKIIEKLTQLSNQFGNNVLDDTQNYQLLITDRKDLNGVSVSILNFLKDQAIKAKKGKDGEDVWLLTLDAPSVIPILKDCKNRKLREKIYRAYISRASSGETDNTPIMVEILNLRSDLSKLLGYSNYSEYSIDAKMAKNAEEVKSFLNDLYQKGVEKAREDYNEIKEYARKLDSLNILEPWDVSYYEERLKEDKYSYSSEELRQYFPEKKVLDGLFEIIKKLYDVEIKEKTGVQVWNSDVKYYNLYKDNKAISGLYMDLYSRKGKKSGAWMSEVITRKKNKNGAIQNPVANLTTNFTPPSEKVTSLLTHEEVLTLFHEMGHVLHHIMTEQNYTDVSGINGVPWDGVELPSQFFENWAWDKKGLRLISKHFESGRAIPDELLDKMINSKNYHSAKFLLRQLEFSLIDIEVHDKNFSSKEEMMSMIESSRKRLSIMPILEEDHFENSFLHIFSGSYAAGYYSYKWAEVLAADCFMVFKEKGVFDKNTAKNFLKSILSRGGSRDFMEMVEDFLGRKPDIESLLKLTGVVNG